MKIIDSHAHLMDEMYEEDREEVIKRCVENNVEIVVNIGYSKETSVQAVEYANKYNWMYATIGLHPDECNISNPDMSFIDDLVKNKKVVATFTDFRHSIITSKAITEIEGSYTDEYER